MDSKYERYMKHTLNHIIAKSVLNLLPSVVEDCCYGCEVDHPSQTHHTCLMWTRHEHLDCYFEQVYEKINDTSILAAFSGQINIMDVSQQCKDIILSDLNEWYKKNKPSGAIVQNICSDLLSLEDRFSTDDNI